MSCREWVLGASRREVDSVCHEIAQHLSRTDVVVLGICAVKLRAGSEVLAIAIIDTTGKILLDNFVLPCRPIPRDVVEQHGLSVEMMGNGRAEPWPIIHCRVVDLLRTAAVIHCWNADCCRRLIEDAATWHGLSIPAGTWRCTRVAEAIVRGSNGSSPRNIPGIDDGTNDDCVRSPAYDARRRAETTLALMRVLAGRRLRIRRAIKGVLKQVPSIHRGLSGLRATLSSVEYRSTNSRARYWADRSDSVIRGYWHSRTNHNRNAFLIPLIEKYEPNSVLEVGCNCGNNLYALASKFPTVRLVGFDINARSVDLGMRWLRDEGITNVELSAGRAEDALYKLADCSFDIVFSWATLMIVRPSKIKFVLAHMTRIARKAVILLEIQSATTLSSRQATGVILGPNWKRDYVSLLTEVTSDYDTALLKPIPSFVWFPGDHGGAVVDARRKGID